MRKVKRKLATIIAIILCMAALTSIAAAVESHVVKGSDLVMENVEILPDSGFVVITEDFQNNSGPILRADPDKYAGKTFTHMIYDRDGVLMANCYATVSGTYSQAGGWAQAESVTASFLESDSFQYTSSKSGAFGYLNIYFNGVFIGSFTYKIATNGVVSQI